MLVILFNYNVEKKAKRGGFINITWQFPAKQKEFVFGSDYYGNLQAFYYWDLKLLGKQNDRVNRLKISIVYELNKWVECSPLARETGVQSQVESYQRFKNGVVYRDEITTVI